MGVEQAVKITVVLIGGCDFWMYDNSLCCLQYLQFLCKQLHEVCIKYSDKEGNSRSMFTRHKLNRQVVHKVAKLMPTMQRWVFRKERTERNSDGRDKNGQAVDKISNKAGFTTNNQDIL